jgi:secretion/DNA translocation related TadE-like protein
VITRRWKARGDESGSGSLLAIAIVATLVAATTLVDSVCFAYEVKQRTARAADLAALAAADTASGLVAGYACESAATAAQLNGATLEHCEVDGGAARVLTRSDYLGIPVSAEARAGPPGSLSG